MIFDGIPFSHLYQHKKDGLHRRVVPFIRFLEQRLNVSVLADRKDFPYERPDLAEQFSLAHILKQKGIIKSFRPQQALCDEPPIKSWMCEYTSPIRSVTAGASIDSDEDALTAALAEGLERYIWITQDDYFKRPIRASVQKIASYGKYIDPRQFVSFSEAQRKADSKLTIKEDSTYMWIRARSHTDNKTVYVPAQTISSAWRPLQQTPAEPLIRQQSTIGLATWPTHKGAILAGALEVIEREAYAIMWFNQLTVPRILLLPLQEENAPLNALVKKCEQYQLRVHALQMPTDAPAHAIAAILEDISGHAPRFAIGLKAHRSLPQAIEGAILEALRARRGARKFVATGPWDGTTPIEKIGHRERLHYWADPKNSERLSFLIGGAEFDYTKTPWENDTETEHLNRVLDWCRANDFTCASVSLGDSKANPTPWYIEMVVIPELHPIHLTEPMRHLGGMRLKNVPRQLGFTPRDTPFIDAPHPYT